MRLSTVFAGILASVGLVAAAPTSCALSESPAFPSTKAAFEGFKNARLYIMGSIVNDDPTHTELMEAAKWQLGQVHKKLDEAVAANQGDAKLGRKIFYEGKLDFLKLELNIADKMVNHGLPKYPWLGKVINWAQGKWKKIKELWNKWFGGKSTDTPAATPAPTSSTINDQKPSSKESAEATAFLDSQDKELTKIEEHLEDLEYAESCSL